MRRVLRKWALCVYNRTAAGVTAWGDLGGGKLQTTRPRDLGMLVLVVGLFLILFLVTMAIGASPG
jgi:hypothetical protein